MVKQRNNLKPLVSICTPTFNRRPFFPCIIKCFESQDYPKDRLEWIIIDDGTDPIEDIISAVPQVKYYRYEKKMSLGEKRNLMHEKATGSILVYMDDDDYYPPNRVSHAVETLEKNPRALCAGSSELNIYFKHLQKMFQFGPYGPNHATAATFAFRRELLNQTKYENDAAVGEEKQFLKNYTIPFVQLDPLKTILVFSHIHNSFDKKILLEKPNKFIKESTKKVTDFIKDDTILHFFMNDIDKLLDSYQPGRPENKPDVVKQIESLTKSRKEMEIQVQNIQQQMQQQAQQQIQEIRNHYESRIAQLTAENLKMKDQIEHLTNKISGLIKDEIQRRKDTERVWTLTPEPPLPPPLPPQQYKDLGWYAKPNSSGRLDLPEFTKDTTPTPSSKIDITESSSS
jgi:DNA-binding transcriptional MerR regulator